jgi:UDP-glucose 4-epimerase
MTHVLVTGGNGFIGQYVVEELLARDKDVVVLDPRGRDPIPGSRVVLGDIRDDVAVTEAMAHADSWIHLGGVLGTAETIDNPRPAALVNVIGGLNVFEAAAQYDLPGVNIAVGNAWSADNTYSITKATVERFAKMYNAYRGTEITTVRALNAYGPRQVPVSPWGPSKVRKIVPSFACRALSGLPIEVYGGGDQVADMIYVKDVAKSLVGALEWTTENGRASRIVEAGSGVPTTVLQIAEEVQAAVERIAGRKVEITHLPMRRGEPEQDVVLGDPTTLLEVGVDPSKFTQLATGVDKTVRYFYEILG